MVKAHGLFLRRMISEDMEEGSKHDSALSTISGSTFQAPSLKAETGSPSHTIGRDSVRMKDPMLHFIRGVFLNLASWPDSQVTTCHPHKMSSAVLNASCFECIYYSLLPGQENESCGLHLKS